MEVETICRYDLPVCVVVFNNNGVYKGTDVNPRGGDVAPTVFVKGARYEMMMQAFGGVGVVASTPAELEKAINEAIASGKPTLVNTIIDETAGTESGRITSLNPTAAANMVIGKEMYGMTIEMVLAMANAYMGSTFVGTARAAYDLALAYAKERVQGGRPLIEHPAMRSRLFKMFTKVEAARAMARRVHMLGVGQPPPVQYSMASKTFVTNTAFEVASDAIQIFGGNGLTKEYPIEKIMRDARAAMIEDGCNEMLSIIGGSRL